MANFVITIHISLLQSDIINKTFAIPGPAFIPQDIPIVIRNLVEIRLIPFVIRNDMEIRIG